MFTCTKTFVHMNVKFHLTLTYSKTKTLFNLLSNMGAFNKHHMLTALIILKRTHCRQKKKKKGANKGCRKHPKKNNGLDPQIWLEIIVLYLFQHLFLQNTMLAKSFSGNLYFRFFTYYMASFMVHLCKFWYKV